MRLLNLPQVHSKRLSGSSLSFEAECLLKFEEEPSTSADDPLKIDERIQRFVQLYPHTRGISSHEDLQDLLAWLSATTSAGNEQGGLPVGDSQYDPVEYASLSKRLAQARFEQLASCSAVELTLPESSNAVVQLNPSHVWAKTESPVSRTVLFYLVRDEVRTTAVGADLEPLLRTLERQPLTVRQIVAKLRRDEREDILAALRKMAALRIIVVSPAN